MLQGNDIMSSANAISGLAYKKQNDVAYYFGLRTMNDSLLNENAKLRAALALYQSVDKVKDSASHVAIKSDDTNAHTIKYADYVFHTARVINNSVSVANNYITINRGSSDGIAKNMAVITGSGIVGRVIHVSSHYASVLSVLSVKQKVSAKLKDGTIGYLTWQGTNPGVMQVEDIPQQIRIKNGDSVFTTNYSFFPSDVLIGTVFKTVAIKKNNQQILYIRPSTNFSNLQYVYVVENKMMEERLRLEDSVNQKQ